MGVLWEGASKKHKGRVSTLATSVYLWHHERILSGLCYDMG